MTSVLGIMIVMGIIGVIFLGLVLTDASDSARQVAWIAGGEIPSAAEAVVYRVYLKRHNLGRLLGGLIGFGIALVVAWRWEPVWHLAIGVGIALPNNLLAWWLGGVITGTLLTEVYHLRGFHSLTVRQADLQPRAPRPNLGAVRATWALTAVAVVLAGFTSVSQTDFSCWPGAVFALLVLGLGEATQRAITNRPRPARGPAAVVDRHLRTHSAQALTWLELAGALLGCATVVSPYHALTTGFAARWGDLPALFTSLAGNAIGLGWAIATLVAIHKSRIQPPRRWQPGSPFSDSANCLAPAFGAAA